MLDNLQQKDSEKQSYRYYSTLRPIAPMTYPTSKKVLNIENFDERKPVAGFFAWGYIEFVEPLSDEDEYDYDLYKDASDKSRLNN